MPRTAATGAPPERTWSVSAAHAYRTCPRQWSYRQGPHRAQHAARLPEPLHRVRGRVLHAAISAAYIAARDELAGMPGGLPGARMDRYARPARTAFGAAWQRELMPSDPDEALDCLRTLAELLGSLPVPAPRTVYAVEQPVQVRIPSGLLVRAVPDLVLRTARPGTVRVVDWKSAGKVTTTDVLDSQQLLVYAYLLALADDQVTGVEIELYSIGGVYGVRETAPPGLVDAAVARLEDTAARADADLDPAPTPGPHCTSCPYRRVCPAVATKVAHAAPVVQCA